MNYQQTLEYLYNSLPVFQRIGAAAYKANLNNTLALDEHLGHPHRSFRTIHIAGTNGKGSTSQMIYAVLRACGLRVGLYTSPHLRDFRERIVVDDQMISQDQVVGFVERNQTFIESVQPSFFEVTVAMAFDHFQAEKVDVAVIEVGMGGRLDSTNIISPLLSVITNIDYDHTQFLGDTLPKIAGEKAGIIKPNTPVVVGQSNPIYDAVFEEKARQEGAPIVFADRLRHCVKQDRFDFLVEDLRTNSVTRYTLGMQGIYQQANLCTALAAIDILRTVIDIPQQALEQGLAQATVRGRWQILAQKPLTICDTGHNKAGIELIVRQIACERFRKLYFVLGVVSDKDLPSVLPLLPKEAYYIFTQAAIPRAMPAEELAAGAKAIGLEGEIVASAPMALSRAQALASDEDMIFVGGSTFTVAEVVP